MRNRRGETEEMRRMRGLIERRSEFVARSTILPPAPEPTTLEGQTQHRITALRLIPLRLYEPRLLDGDDD